MGTRSSHSEFLLLKAEGPTVVWRQKMDWVDVGSVSDSHGNDEGFQKGDPLIYRSGSKLLILAPSRDPNLTVYEIDEPQ